MQSERRTCLALLVCAILLGGARPASASVLVVAGNGSGDFTTIAAAAAAANDGDTLLVRPGFYTSFTLGSKSLTVLADGAGQVVIGGPIGIENQPAGKSIVLSGLVAHGTSGAGNATHGYGLYATHCAGATRVNSCTFSGGNGQTHDEGGWVLDGFMTNVVITGHVAGWPAVLLDDVTGSVAFNNSIVTGGAAASVQTFDYGDCGCSYGLPGGAGVEVSSAHVALYATASFGGDGSTADRVGGIGGAGVDAGAGSDVMLGASNFKGGDGGFAWDYIGTVYGGDGGDGVLARSGSQVRLLDNVFAGGTGGGSLTNNPGATGAGVGGAGSTTFFGGDSRKLLAGSPAYVGSNLQLAVTGNPGDMVLLLIGTSPGWLASAKFQGQVLVPAPLVTLLIGPMPGSGVLQLSSPVPGIAPFESVGVYLQAIVGGGSGATLTGSSALTLVDATFHP